MCIFLRGRRGQPEADGGTRAAHDRLHAMENHDLPTSVADEVGQLVAAERSLGPIDRTTDVAARRVLVSHVNNHKFLHKAVSEQQIKEKEKGEGKKKKK